MGNSDSGPIKLPSFQHQNWHPIQLQRPPRPEYGSFRLHSNNLTNEQVQEYMLYFNDSKQYQRYIELFAWRQRQDNIVNGKYINTQENNQFCYTSHNALVFIEHIPFRLCNIRDIPLPDYLYVLASVIDGFEKLYSLVGYFMPREDLVCIDGDGKVKVWLNPDLSRGSSVDHDQEVSGDERNIRIQEKMVEEIIVMVEQNSSDQHQCQESFFQYFWRNHKNRKSSFRQAKAEVYNYAKGYGIEIPHYFEAVMGILKNQQESQEQEQRGQDRRGRQEEERILSQNRQNVLDSSRKNIVNTQTYESRKPQQQEGHHQSLVVAALPHLNENRQTFNERPAQNSFHVQSSQPAVRVSRPQSPNTKISGVSGTNLNIRFNYQGSNSEARTANFIPVSMSDRTFGGPNTLRVEQPAAPKPISPVYTLPEENKPIFQEMSAFRLESKQQPQPQPQFQPQSQQYSEQARYYTAPSTSKTSNIVYSDSTETYLLDEEIASDIKKYFGDGSL